MAETKKTVVEPEQIEIPDHVVVQHGKNLAEWAHAVVVCTHLLERKLRLEGQVDMLERRLHDGRNELERLTERVAAMKNEIRYAR